MSDPYTIGPATGALPKGFTVKIRIDFWERNERAFGRNWTLSGRWITRDEKHVHVERLEQAIDLAREIYLSYTEKVPVPVCVVATVFPGFRAEGNRYCATFRFEDGTH